MTSATGQELLQLISKIGAGYIGKIMAGARLLPRGAIHVFHQNTAQAQSEARITPAFVCRHYGKAMAILQCFVRGQAIRAPPS